MSYQQYQHRRIEPRRKRKLSSTTKSWVWNTWRQYSPEWFVTLLWNDLPTSPVTASSHTRHLRNVLLCNSCGVGRCDRLPDFPDRLGLTFFQERTEVQGSKVTFHTHVHISNSNNRWNSPEELHYYLRYVIGSRVDKLLKSDTKHNEGVVVKRWVEENHMSYNFKEMERQRKSNLTRYVQDNDLLLDVENSDLLPLTNSRYGHETVLPTTHTSL